MAAWLESSFEFGRPEAQPLAPRDADAPLRMLIMGDFSGLVDPHRAKRGSLVERPVLRVDQDNFDELMRRMAPRCVVPQSVEGDTLTEIAFQQLDDFRPEELYKRLGVFQSLRQLRQRLVDPSTFAEAAAELTESGPERPPIDPLENRGPDQDSKQIGVEDGARLLNDILAAPDVPDEGPSDQGSRVLQNYVKQIVGPYLVPLPGARQDHLVQSVDEAIGGHMRSVLHHRDFQSLEATWRSVHWLVRSVELSESLQVYLYDVTKRELADDLASADADFQTSQLYRRLVEQGTELPGGQPWSLLVGGYEFGANLVDLRLLARLSAVACQAGGPFLSTATASLVGCRSIADLPDPHGWQELKSDVGRAWQALRSSPLAVWIGLAVPRVLLRLPYGRRTDPVDGFEFEELQRPAAEHDAYLWGSSAIACAILIARAFQRSGWSFRPGDELELANIPAHVFEDHGQPSMKPCAEVLLPERALLSLLERGLMPMVCEANRDVVRLLRFQSIADPALRLAGPWGGG